MKNELEKQIPDIIEPILLVNYKAQLVGKSKMTDLLPLLRMLAVEYDVDLKTPLGFTVSKRALINCVLNN